jgi:hypothetical protein
MPKILIKRGTATQWSASTTALLPGELGLDTTNNILKVGNGTSLWAALSGISFTNELAQDAIGLALDHEDHSNIVVTYDDATNKIILSSGPDLVTFADLGNSLGDYIPLSYYGNIDGVATLDSNGLIPDTQIPSTIARDSELFSGSYDDLTNKPSLFSGSYDDLTNKPTIPSLNGYATENYVTTAVSNSTAALVNSAPSTLDTLHEIATALGNDANLSTTLTNSIALKAPIESPTFTGTVGGITKSMVGLGNVDNTSDANKPISTATQTALDLKLDSSTASTTYATIASPTFSGTPLAPTASLGTNTTQIATTAFVKSEVNDNNLNGYIPSTSTSITLSSSTHNFKILEVTASSAITVTIPNDTQDTGWSVGSVVEVRQSGSGQITIGKDAAVTLNAPENQLKTRVQWSSLFLEKRAANSWLVTGDATA